MTKTWIPPTPTPQSGQGPWCNLDLSRWWVIAEYPEDALRIVRTTDADTFPHYGGWKVTLTPVQICWVRPEDWNEENEIHVCPAGVDDDDRVDAWQIDVEDC